MAETTTLKAGDVVQLKSGGPKMTVAAASDNYGTPKVSCVWFDDSKKKLSDSFPPATLEKH
jgi:uncharacterized protein YodC (DUF2158 family)